MRILVGKTFGIGNACLSVPMIKSLFGIGTGTVDVLVGSGPDDFGAIEVFRTLQETWPSPARFVNRIHVDRVPDSEDPYDVAIMAIPFDGRWQNGVHYRAREVLDGRKRPDNVDRLGFDMWKKHEIEYQMENARALGYDGPTPDGSFMPRGVPDPDLVYVGLGYKRDPGGFGASKHYGNARYAALLEEIRRLRPSTRFVSTGSPADLIQSWYQIVKMHGPGYSQYYRFPMLDLTHSFRQLASCSAYVGNDTGMMHVAASLGMPTCGLFSYPDLLVKNPPFCDRSRGILFTPDSPSSEEVARLFVSFAWE